MDREKQIYNIILTWWKFLKPWATEIPRTDKDWDDFVKGLDQVSAELKASGIGLAEHDFVNKMALACMDYVQQREMETRRAPD